MSFKIRVSGIKALRDKISSILSRLVKARPANLDASKRLLVWIHDNFAVEGRNHEDRSLVWKSLHPITIRRRLQKHGAQHRIKILTETGALRNSFKIRVTDNTASVESDLSYARLHESGGVTMIDGKRVFVPQRKILPTAQQAGKIVLPAYKRYIQRILR